MTILVSPCTQTAVWDGLEHLIISTSPFLITRCVAGPGRPAQRSRLTIDLLSPYTIYVPPYTAV